MSGKDANSSIFDDDDEWQDMPVVRSTDDGSDSDDDPVIQAHRRRTGTSRPYSSHPLNKPTISSSSSHSNRQRSSSSTSSLNHNHRSSFQGNATGTHIKGTSAGYFGASGGGGGGGGDDGDDDGGEDWREKREGAVMEGEYTRLGLEEDRESEEVWERTGYLFNDEKSLTPLNQLAATKSLLTDSQRIAYVGLCNLVVREMARSLRLGLRGPPPSSNSKGHGSTLSNSNSLGSTTLGGGGGGGGKKGGEISPDFKELISASESLNNWSIKIMGRLYQHMEVIGDEQRMIENLGNHGLTSDDLVPSLVTTHKIPNPEYDPQVEKEVREIKEREDELERMREFDRVEGEIGMSLDGLDGGGKESLDTMVGGGGDDDGSKTPKLTSPTLKDYAPEGEGDDDEGDIGGSLPLDDAKTPRLSNGFLALEPTALKDNEGGDIGSALEGDDDEGDLGATKTPGPKRISFADSLSTTSTTTKIDSTPPAPKSALLEEYNNRDRSKDDDYALQAPAPSEPKPDPKPSESQQQQDNSLLAPLPHTLPGVSTSLTAADKDITLDIRWTILCDLFLLLIADSVYDARSRVLLNKMANKLGLNELDVSRFERRLTEAMELQESTKKNHANEVLEDRRLKGKKKRYVMMGLATLGGGLVIGLSAGLLAPVIGAGLGAAFTTFGIGGTSTFLAGTGGAALITTGGVVTGGGIGLKGMAKRTKHVSSFEFIPVHNNKRLNAVLAIPGFMQGQQDDVRLPYSVLDPVHGDLFALCWEPEMMGETGNILKILTSEVLTQMTQQVLQATIMTALMSALQWPVLLTKLGYLIDNPWSNALDRSKAAGAVLADVIINRTMGIRPISLVGFSLGARVIFYALVELAKAKVFGIVQDVYLLGATVTADVKIWRQVRGVVSGRFVNGFARNDWVLGYLFRATTGGLQTVAGLRPVEHVPDLENVDLTGVVQGHMSYRSLMPKILEFVGFKVTADHFDEPDDPENDLPEREIITKEEEERRAREKERKKMNIFQRMATGRQSMDSSNTSSQANSGTQPYSIDEDDLPPRQEKPKAEVTNPIPEEEDDDDLPPREDHIQQKSREDEGIPTRLERDSEDSLPPREAVPQRPRATREESQDSTLSEPPSSAEEEEEQEQPPKSAGVGFDLERIRNEIEQSKDLTGQPQQDLEPPTPKPNPPPPEKKKSKGGFRSLFSRPKSTPPPEQKKAPTTPPATTSSSPTTSTLPFSRENQSETSLAPVPRSDSTERIRHSSTPGPSPLASTFPTTLAEEPALNVEEDEPSTPPAGGAHRRLADDAKDDLRRSWFGGAVASPKPERSLSHAASSSSLGHFSLPRSSTFDFGSNPLPGKEPPTIVFGDSFNGGTAGSDPNLLSKSPTPSMTFGSDNGSLSGFRGNSTLSYPAENSAEPPRPSINKQPSSSSLFSSTSANSGGGFAFPNPMELNHSNASTVSGISFGTSDGDISFGGPPALGDVWASGGGADPWNAGGKKKSSGSGW